MEFVWNGASRKKSKDLKNELKKLKKELTEGGCARETAALLTKELQRTLELAGQLSSDYTASREQLAQARTAIGRLLDCMGESPAEEVRKSLQELEKNLDLIYHECSIRTDDMDFRSTIDCYKRLVQEYDGGASIMLRSELENMKAVLDDAAGWTPPDFMALAYFILHEDRSELKEMENEQRNQRVSQYYEERFYREFEEQAKRAGVYEAAAELIQNYGN